MRRWRWVLDYTAINNRTIGSLLRRVEALESRLGDELTNLRIQNLAAAVEALMRKVGTDGSDDSDSLDWRVTVLEQTREVK